MDRLRSKAKFSEIPHFEVSGVWFVSLHRKSDKKGRIKADRELTSQQVEDIYWEYGTVLSV